VNGDRLQDLDFADGIALLDSTWKGIDTLNIERDRNGWTNQFIEIKQRSRWKEN